jgi:transposase
MPARLSIAPHPSLDALERRYRTDRGAVGRSHWQITWLLARGGPSEQVAAVTGYTVNWGRTLAQRYNQQGPAGLGDRRHRNPGRTGLLSAALKHPPPDGGVWTGPKAAAWVATTLGHRVHPQRGWEMLRRSGWNSKVPRPRHARADPVAQMAFKKTSRA